MVDTVPAKPSKAEVAEAHLNEGFGCAQSVFAAFADEIGMDRETALRIAGPFGGGMGGLGWTCGAVTGAIMVIGFLYGRTDPEDKAAKQANNARVQELVRLVEEREGTSLCREILKGYDISNPEERELARQERLFESGCQKTVGDAAEILEGLLARWRAT
jgi:C_GCAxxG_C_C family probable redox protein